MECICRKYLDTRSNPESRLNTKIEEECLKCQVVILTWSKISHSISQDVRCAMLKAIVKLWVSIRVHSFAESWSDKMQADTLHHTKALRTSLKRKGTEKDATKKQN